MKSGHIIVAVAASAIGISSANAATIATFADPTSGATPSLFQWSSTTQTLSGGWSGLGLKLETPGTSAPDYLNATFVFAPLVATGSFFGITAFGAGSIEFYDASNVSIFKIDFDQALMNSSLSFGSSDFIAYNVRFSGSILDYPTQNEAFAFSFANPLGSASNFTVTSSFTSSADRLIPTPGAAALMGLGGLLAARRRRA